MDTQSQSITYVKSSWQKFVQMARDFEQLYRWDYLTEDERNKLRRTFDLPHDVEQKRYKDGLQFGANKARADDVEPAISNMSDSKLAYDFRELFNKWADSINKLDENTLPFPGIGVSQWAHGIQDFYNRMGFVILDRYDIYFR